MFRDIERCAQALYEANPCCFNSHRPFDPTPWDKLREFHKERFRMLAKTADAALTAHPAESQGLRPEYLEMMQTHVDEGGRLGHRNGLDLLAEVIRLRARAEKGYLIVRECAAALGNGATLAPECTDEFHAELPGEIKAYVSTLRNRLANERQISIEHAAQFVDAKYCHMDLTHLLRGLRALAALKGEA